MRRHEPLDRRLRLARSFERCGASAKKAMSHRVWQDPEDIASREKADMTNVNNRIGSETLDLSKFVAASTVSGTFF
jgi:hypothetical protein